MKSYQDEVIWIIGASSGIGAALARELAGRGAVLALSARREERLENLRQELGSHHKVFSLDVSDYDLVANTTQAIWRQFERVDRIIFLAATYMPATSDKMDAAMAKQIVDINLLGALYTIIATLPALRRQSNAQIALYASVAGYIGLPDAQPYSATKAAIINLAESLRAKKIKTVDIKLINSGFVRTDLTAKNNFTMPMIISAERAAQYIADGLLTTRFEIHFPRRFTFWVKLLRILPYNLALKITQKLKK